MNCTQFQSYYYTYLRDKGSVPPEAAEHLKNCKDCQEQIDRLGGELQSQITEADDKVLLRDALKLHASLLDRWVSCGDVRPLLPSMLIDVLRIAAVTPITAHLEHCAKCRTQLKDVQSLRLTTKELIAAAAFLSGERSLPGLKTPAQKVLQVISQSDESGIETKMSSTSQDSARDAQAGSDRIQVRHGRHAFVAPRFRTLNYVLTGGIAAAAMIFLVVMLLPTVASGNLKKVNQAINSVSNVHVLRYSAQNQLIQELWISRKMGFKLYKQHQNTLFKDLNTGRILQLLPGGEPSYLDEGIREDDKYAQLLPFEQVKDLSLDYEWTFKGQAALNDGRQVKVYELTWETLGSNLALQRKWRGYLDIDSNLPYKIEWLEKVADKPFELFTTLHINYPTESECRELLEAEGFQRFLIPNQSE